MTFEHRCRNHPEKRAKFGNAVGGNLFGGTGQKLAGNAVQYAESTVLYVGIDPALGVCRLFMVSE